MRYLAGTPFTVAVGNGKLTQAQWEKAVGLPVREPKTLREFMAHPDDCPCKTCCEFRDEYPARTPVIERRSGTDKVTRKK